MVSKGFPNVTTSGRQYNIGEKPSVILYTYINLHAGTLVVVGSHMQRIVLAAKETTVTQEVSHRRIKCQSRWWSQICTKKVNGSHHHGHSPLLKPTGVQIATKPIPGPTNREHRKLIRVKTTMSLWVRITVSTLLSGVLPVVQNLNYKLLQRLPVLPDVLPNQQTKSSKVIQKVF